MTTTEDIEGYLIQMGVNYEEIAKQTWLIQDDRETLKNIVISLNDPVVVFHVKLMEIPAKCDRIELYETLLSLNTTDMMAGAYGLENNAVVATDTLQSENLDFNEFQASVDALHMCITDHYKKKLARFHTV